jgi:hypothetical protein
MRLAAAVPPRSGTGQSVFTRQKYGATWMCRTEEALTARYSMVTRALNGGLGKYGIFALMREMFGDSKAITICAREMVPWPTTPKDYQEVPLLVDDFQTMVPPRLDVGTLDTPIHSPPRLTDSPPQRHSRFRAVNGRIQSDEEYLSIGSEDDMEDVVDEARERGLKIKHRPHPSVLPHQISRHRDSSSQSPHALQRLRRHPGLLKPIPDA